MSLEFKTSMIAHDGYDEDIRYLDIADNIAIQIEEDNTGHFNAKFVGAHFISHSSEDTERLVLNFLQKIYELVKESKEK